MNKRKLFGFDRHAEKQIRERQRFRCAHCGKHLGHWNCKTIPNYHHVVPVQAANPADPEDAFVKSPANGVLLCARSAKIDEGEVESCHGDVAHGDGRYAAFAAYATEFPYSHGGDARQHEAWVRTIERHFRRLFTGIHSAGG